MSSAFHGGYDVLLDGRPSATICEPPSVSSLHLPIRSKRLAFLNILVSHGDRVEQGQVLALDGAQYECPLLAPCAGTVDLEAAADHITLNDADLHPVTIWEDDRPKSGASGSEADIRRRLIELGVWQFLADALTGAVPDPAVSPSDVIVSTLRLDSFETRGDVLLANRESDFALGIDALQSAAPTARFHLIVPDVKSVLLSHVLMTLMPSNIESVRVPLRYPFDSPRLLAGKLGLDKSGGGPIWTLGVETALAAADAMMFSKPCTTRIISMGGPGVAHHDHFRVPLGYPIQSLISACVSTAESVRVINGGALSGCAVPHEQLGIDVECSGLTIIPEQTKREFVSFAQPGFNKHSYCRCLLSVFRASFRERYTTAMQGEKRPCFSCNFCDNVCPAGIIPFLLYRYLTSDILEEADRNGIARCIGCGLCSYICPAKIDLSETIIRGQETVQKELHSEDEAA